MKLNRKKIIIITVLLTASLAGLIWIQVQLLKDSYDQKEQVFNQNVLSALNSTAKMLEVNEAAKNIFEYTSDTLLPKPRLLPNPKLPAEPDIVVQRPKIIQQHIDKLLKENKRKGSTSFIVITDNDSTTVHVNSYSDKGKGDSTVYGYSYSVSSSDGKDKRVGMSYKFGDAVDELKRLDSARKKLMVTKVVDKLIIADQIPIERRISKTSIDSVLRINFRNNGINTRYDYGVLVQLGDTTKLVLCNRSRNDLKNSKLKTLLYPSDIFPVKNFLSVVFPDSRYFLYKQLFPQLILSALFILIIIFSFVYTVRIIWMQKKVGGLIIDFINNMTHEFKTPISTIALASEAIVQPEILNNEERLLKYNGIIRDENSRMKSQVDKILQMALLEEGDYELNLSVVDLHEMINGTAINMGVLIEKMGGRLETNLSASRHKIKGDPVHLSNIISNLIDNAIKYSPGNLHIIVQTHNEDNKIVLSFIDNGMGIKEDDLKRVFDKYFRVPTGNQHDIKGFGLGLTYVKLMVEAHGGSIKMKSKPGTGTTVDIILPVLKME